MANRRVSKSLESLETTERILKEARDLGVPVRDGREYQREKVLNKTNTAKGSRRGGRLGSRSAMDLWHSDQTLPNARNFWRSFQKKRKNSERGPFLTTRRSPVPEKSRWLKKNAAGSDLHYRRLLHNSWGQGDIGFGDHDARPWRLLWTRAAMTLRSANREVLMHLACDGKNNTHAAVSVEKAHMNPNESYENIGQWLPKYGTKNWTAGFMRSSMTARTTRTEPHSLVWETVRVNEEWGWMMKFCGAKQFGPCIGD